MPGGLVVPGEPGADVPVSVQTAAGITTAATAFQVLSAPPEFADQPFAPTSGRAGTSVNMSGRNFNVGTPRVFFGAVEAALLAAPAAEALTVAVPAGLVTPGEPGANVPVSVQTASGTTTAVTTFRAKPPMPQFVHPFLSPAEAHRGQEILLHGLNFHWAPVRVYFRLGTSLMAVPILGTPMSSKIKVRVPSLSHPGAPVLFVDVIVTTAGGFLRCPKRLRITPISI